MQLEREHGQTERHDEQNQDDDENTREKQQITVRAAVRTTKMSQSLKEDKVEKVNS